MQHVLYCLDDLNLTNSEHQEKKSRTNQAAAKPFIHVYIHINVLLIEKEYCD